MEVRVVVIAASERPKTLPDSQARSVGDLLQSRGLDWINFGSSARGNVAGQQRETGKEERGADQKTRIVNTDGNVVAKGSGEC